MKQIQGYNYEFLLYRDVPGFISNHQRAVMSIPSSGTGTLVTAVGWVQQVLLGSAATAIAIIAVASVGFMALSGRIDLRQSVTVIIGCFILFGAPSVVAGLQAAIAGGAGEVARSVAPPPAPVFQPPPRQPFEAQPYDPYSGAAVPTR
ncbi:TrbC/VirB2 family protein [Sphingomonas sp. ZT3P38]|uniref:TrbC/VirB2 family protein n=1 Tax=Parasphingomonas zepuensis TaxID=3096161 RepID=UPI002FCB1950